MEKDDQDGHQAALDRMEWRKMTNTVTRRCLIDGVEKDGRCLRMEWRNDQDGHQAALDRMEWRKMTKITRRRLIGWRKMTEMVTRRCLIGWSGER